MTICKRNREHVLCLGLILMAALPLMAQDQKETPIEVLTTKEGIRFGIWPSSPKEPSPVLFVLGSSIEGTLGSDYFRMSGNQLAKKGYICVSIDLPCHGQEQREGEPEGIAGWRFRLENGDNPITEATQRLSDVLNHLVDLGWVDTKRIAVTGTSRGGFMATHFAAAEPRIRCVAAIAPVADLTDLREFTDVKNKVVVDQLALEHQAERLAGKGVCHTGAHSDYVEADDVTPREVVLEIKASGMCGSDLESPRLSICSSSVNHKDTRLHAGPGRVPNRQIGSNDK